MSELKLAGWALIFLSAFLSLPFVALYAVAGHGVPGAAGFTAAVITGGLVMFAAGIGILIAASRLDRP